MAYTVRAPDEKLRIVFGGIKAENISHPCLRRDRPHQSLSYVTPYDMLIGRAEEAIQQTLRKKKHIAAQQRRKEVNKRMAE